MPVQMLSNRNNYIICYCMPVQKLLNIYNMSLVKFVAATEVT